MDADGATTKVDLAWRDLQTARTQGDEAGVRHATAQLRELDQLRIAIDRRAPLTSWQRVASHRWVVPVLAGIAAALATVVAAELAAGIPTSVLVAGLAVGAVVAWIVALATPGAPQDTDAMLRSAGSWFQPDG